MGIKGTRLMGKGLGDNYREGTGRGVVGQVGPTLLICPCYADNGIPMSAVGD